MQCVNDDQKMDPKADAESRKLVRDRDMSIQKRERKRSPGKWQEQDHRRDQSRIVTPCFHRGHEMRHPIDQRQINNTKPDSNRPTQRTKDQRRKQQPDPQHIDDENRTLRENPFTEHPVGEVLETVTIMFLVLMPHVRRKMQADQNLQ